MVKIPTQIETDKIECGDSSGVVYVDLIICDDCLMLIQTGNTSLTEIQNRVVEKIKSILNCADSDYSRDKARALGNSICQGNPLYVSCKLGGNPIVDMTFSYTNICKNHSSLDGVL
jgi:hypothetical protein